jgi:hypothetical protein
MCIEQIFIRKVKSLGRKKRSQTIFLADGNFSPIKSPTSSRNSFIERILNEAQIVNSDLFLRMPGVVSSFEN